MNLSAHFAIVGVAVEITAMLMLGIIEMPGLYPTADRWVPRKSM